MRFIHTDMAIEHPPIRAFPALFAGKWDYENFYIESKYHKYLRSYGNDREKPYFHIGYDGNDSTIASEKFYNLLNKGCEEYYINYVRPYNVPNSFQFSTYLQTHIALWTTFFTILDLTKTNYYDISVGDDEPGDTWKSAIFTLEYEITSYCRRESITRSLSLNGGKVNKKQTTYYPTKVLCLLNSYYGYYDSEGKWHKGDNTFPVTIKLIVYGEHKELDPSTGKLIRTPITDKLETVMPVPINNI